MLSRRIGIFLSLSAQPTPRAAGFSILRTSTTAPGMRPFSTSAFSQSTIAPSLAASTLDCLTLARTFACARSIGRYQSPSARPVSATAFPASKRICPSLTRSHRAEAVFQPGTQRLVVAVGRANVVEPVSVALKPPPISVLKPPATFRRCRCCAAQRRADQECWRGRQRRTNDALDRGSRVPP